MEIIVYIVRGADFNTPQQANSLQLMEDLTTRGYFACMQPGGLRGDLKTELVDWVELALDSLKYRPDRLALAVQFPHDAGSLGETQLELLERYLIQSKITYTFLELGNIKQRERIKERFAFNPPPKEIKVEGGKWTICMDSGATEGDRKAAHISVYRSVVSSHSRGYLSGTLDDRGFSSESLPPEPFSIISAMQELWVAYKEALNNYGEGE